MLDENNERVTPYAISNETERDDYSAYNVAAFHEMFYTQSVGTGRPTGALKKICTQITSNPQGRSITIDHGYNINVEWGQPEVSDYEYIVSAVTNRTYYMYINSNTQVILNRPASGITSSATITVSGYGDFYLSCNATEH